ncbi:Glycosyltransferase involved in cell wall bisynthesis [Novosphingobium sp. CF614]|uniref:glycosyltransferase family 4 protein n=1 Tax=Novosphingobium sp. CF614 TaxID=1884364 RepID=UPI0008F3BB36|nr:glycosyltransferase family 4 protein [Novosphingobium sp. CF614]SFG01680.1 Glycosyltransferase involved in cell wall bisynthesis [Novosphingobium sp. CF614]
MHTPALRVAFVGNALPRRCGIATFTTDLELAVGALDEIAETSIVAMREPGGNHAFPEIVGKTIRQEEAGDYLAGADFINREGFDLVCLQHEYGIFGGDAGALVLDLIAKLDAPLVTTLHTVLDRPNPAQRRVMETIIAASARVIVMARKAREILIETYGANPDRIDVIGHGIPDVPLTSSRDAKERLGFAGRKVILTFGLISPNKGIETIIEAMPEIVKRSPDIVYVVMGATHPILRAEEGERYRDSLVDRVRELGLDDHVVFINRFVDRPELLEHIAMCDVYATPYLVASQMTSGTLAYSHGVGRPVVSTPYWHAAELLADGSGVLVPFDNPAGFGPAIAALLGDETQRLAMGRKAYAASRPMTWANTALRYAASFRSACREGGIANRKGPEISAFAPRTARALLHPAFPAMALEHFTAMCDDTGMFQHAVHAIPDRDHGYCIDDNARALLLCCSLAGGPDASLADRLSSTFAAFIQHGWNPDNRRFRNFMGFNRQWLEPAGSEDSHGRTLWALGTYSAHASAPGCARWAKGLFSEALEGVAAFTSPRAWAFTLLGLAPYCTTHPEDHAAARMRVRLAGRLEELLRANETPKWTWFEDALSYDNARLPQALIVTGAATDALHLVDAGLRSLRWLIAMQIAPQGHFRPIGSHGFLQAPRSMPQPFDQQPLEACATIAACAAARDIDPEFPWQAEAERAFDWFLGANDLAVELVDVATGSCRDGLHPDRANENRGAESTLSYLLGLADMKQLKGADRSTLMRAVQGVMPLPIAAVDG